MYVASALNLYIGDLFTLRLVLCTAPVPVLVSLNEKQKRVKSVTRNTLVLKELARGHVLTLLVPEFYIQRRVSSTKHTKGGS